MSLAGYHKTDVAGGFYTVREAARLLGMEQPQRIVRWLSAPSKGTPIILRDYEKAGKEHELSFLDLVEVRFVEHFRQQKISLQSLRVAAANARSVLQVSHPFAMSHVKFQTDRKKIFLETAKETEDRKLLDLMTNNFVIYEAIERALAKHLEFDVSGLARVWRPAPNISPNVLVSPVYAFGRPVISHRHVPTQTLFNAWQAAGGDEAEVADWHGIPAADVLEAVEFELRPLN